MKLYATPVMEHALSLDGLAYVLAVGGENAMAMHDFMMAVGRYLVKVKHTPRADKETAKAELIRSFEEWLSKQTI
jgi:hypothetical protein